MSTTVGLLEHFRRLIDFKGREDRGSFWPYAALVYGIMTVGSIFAILPLMRSMRPASDVAAEQSAQMAPDMGTFFAGMMIITAVAVLLYGAAIVRRLHDRGLSGFWGLMPLPFLLFSMVKMQDFFGSFGSAQRDMDSFSQVFISNAVYMLTLIALIVLLARRSDPYPNRYDAGPIV